MNWFLLGLFTAMAVGMVLPAIWRKDYRLQFPCLAGFAVLFQVALPLASLNLHPEVVSARSLARFSVMAILCLGAAWAGYRWWNCNGGVRNIAMDKRRMAISAVILTAFGFAFSLRYGTIEPEFDPEKGGMTGVGTIFLTLAMVMRYGFVLAAILFMRTKDWKLLPVMIPQLWAYYGLFLVGRRGMTGEVFVIACLLLFFYRKWVVPLWFLVTGTFLAAVFIFNIGQIRATIGEPFRDRVASFVASNPLHALTLSGMAEDHNYVEIFNAAKFMEAKTEGGHYTFGLHFWNQLVFGFVPGQIVGKAVKESLMIPLVDDAESVGFEKSTGTCESGIAEAFMAFGYFGCILFFALGAWMRWLWEGAVRSIAPHQFMLMLCTVGAGMSFTSQLWTFVNMLVNIALFAGPFLWWSSVRAHKQPPAARRQRSVARSRHGAKGEQAAQPGEAVISRPSPALRERRTT